MNSYRLQLRWAWRNQAGAHLGASAARDVPATRGARPQLHALTGLRFFAALLVVLYHRRDLVAYPEPIEAIVSVGFTGVGLFFVLSGFVLAYSYSAADRLAPRQYAVARLARIYPVYLVGLLVALPIFANASLQRGTVQQDLVNGVLVLTMLQAWVPEAAAAWNSPAWSLSVEAFFYVLFPAVLPLLKRLDASRLLVLFACSAVISMVPPWIAQSGFAGHPSSYVIGVLYHTPVLRLAEFLMGMATGLLYLHNQARGSRAVRVASFVAPLVVLGAMYAGSDLAPALLTTGIFAVPFALLVYVLAAAQGIVQRFFALGPIVRLGEASYGIYILHEPLWTWMSFLVFRFVDVAPALQVLIYVLATIGTSLTVYTLVEVPARRWLRARFGTRMPATT